MISGVVDLLVHNGEPLAEVRSAMLDALGDRFGNPSSAHGAGHRGRDQLRCCRRLVAQLLGADADRLVFTSSGTEVNYQNIEEKDRHAA